LIDDPDSLLTVCRGGFSPSWADADFLPSRGAAPIPFAGPSCETLSGADGLAVAPDGNLVLAINHLNKLVSIEGAGQTTTLLTSDPLDFPTSLAFAGGALYIGKFAFLDAKNPGLLRVE